MSSSPCSKRNSRTLLLATAVIIFLVYLPLNIGYMLLSPSLNSAADQPLDKHDKKHRIAAEITNIEADVNGNVNIVLTLGIKELLGFLEGDIATDGEATKNSPPHDVKILINNPHICTKSDNLKYIVYIHTSPDHFHKRDLLRKTWMNTDMFQKRILERVFLMGVSDKLETQQKVKTESQEHGDIIQGDFVDNYRNLTLKGLLGLRWVTTYCKQAAFTIKADDDAFVNIFALIHLLEEHENKKKMLACPLWGENSMPILRDPSKCAKWCVRFSEFPGRRYFPKYCAGLTYIMSQELVPAMYEASKSTPFFWIDDVYITGILPAKVKEVEYVPLIQNLTLKPDVAMEEVKDLKHPFTRLFIHGKKPELFIPMWEALLNRLSSEELKKLNTTFVKKHSYLKNISAKLNKQVSFLR